MKRLLLLALAVQVSSAFAAAGITPDDAVARALRRSPEVVSADSALRAAQGQLREDATFLENPEVDAQVSSDGSRFDLGASQAISLTGAGLHARAADRAAIEAATHDLARTRLVLAHDARAAWAAAVLGANKAALARQDLDLASRLVGAVEARRRAGGASDLDVRLARLTEASAASAWLSARIDQDEAVASLVALAGDAEVDAEADVLASTPAAGAGTTSRSDVAAAAARVTSAEAALRRARAAALPSIQLGAFVERDGAQLTVGPALGLELPLWSRNQAERAASAGDVEVARAQAAQVQSDADAEILRAHTLSSDAETVASLGSPKLVDEARTALAEVERGYTAGALTLQDAIELRRGILDGQTSALGLAGQVVRARLDLLLALEDPSLLPPGDR